MRLRSREIFFWRT